MTDYITLSLIITAIIESALGVMVLFAEDPTHRTRLYSINILTILTWVGSMIFFRTTDQAHIYLWTQILYMSASLIASSFLHFTYFFPTKDKLVTKKKLLIIFLINLLLGFLLFFTNTIIKEATVTNNIQNTIEFGSLYFLYVLYILGFFLYSFYRLYIRYKTSETPLEKRQAYYLFLGYSLSGYISFPTNLLLPWVHIFALNWAGQISTILMVAFATYAVVKHQLFNIKAIAVEFSIGALWIFVLIRTIISTSNTDRLINGGLFLLTIIVGVLLIRGVLQEVRSRERIEGLAKDLEEANKRLQELDQQKSEFVSLASHQLRGPLTAIKGYASLILEGDFGEVPPTIKEAVDKIFKSTQALVILVGDYLDVSRIEQGRMKYDFSTFNLKELVASIIEELRPNIAAAKLDITFDFNVHDDYNVNADQGKIKQVISNLIDNSTKYTPKGWIKVAIEKKDGNILISIKDTGVGIRPDVLPRLFEKFTRAPDASKTNIMGTGLGLYVAKKMIEAHNGKIWAESEGPDRGSSFFIQLKAE